MNDTLIQAILEALQKRAQDHGDEFEVKGSQVQVRCFHPDKHQNGDAHPSAIYYLGKYIFCMVCNFKEGEKKLADRLGIGSVEGGLTLSELARLKGMPADYLQKWGWRTQRGNDGRAGVLIPWYDMNGVMKSAPAYHIRHHTNKNDTAGPRFTWDLPKGIDLLPYGAWRIPEWLEDGGTQGIASYVFITESEMDAVTCWLHGIPAVATGGAGGWRKAWAKCFAQFTRVVIAQEPGVAGSKMVKHIAEDLLNLKREGSNTQPPESRIEVLACPFPEDTKDMNALHLRFGGDNAKFVENLKILIAQAIPAVQILTAVQTEEQVEKRRQQEEEKARLETIAKPLLDDPAELHKAIHAVEDSGVVGERLNIGLLRLQVRSRALKRPVNIEVNSASSSGKTHTVSGTLSLEAPEAYYELTAGSERALIFLPTPLVHRILYIQEPEGLTEGVGLAVIKSLVWEGRVKYDTVVKQNGELVAQHIEKGGPTGLIVTTTRSLDEQISNRMLRVEADASCEQTKRVLHAIANRVNGGECSTDFQPWHAFSCLLGMPIDVDIAFSDYLAGRIATSALRIRRDFTHLLTLIQASAVEYQYQRSRLADGRIAATVADYAHVYSLVKDTFQAAQEEGITKADREMVAAVEFLTTPTGGKPGEQPVSQAAIRSHLELSKSQISYRVNRLLSAGYLVNQENRKGRPQQLVPGSLLPNEVPPLPSPCDVTDWCLKNNRTDLVIPWVDPIAGTVHDCATHTNIQRVLTNRTPEPCPRCVKSESNQDGPASNRTPEPLPAPVTGSSGGSVEAEPPESRHGLEASGGESSAVRLEEDTGEV